MSMKNPATATTRKTHDSSSSPLSSSLPLPVRVSSIGRRLIGRPKLWRDWQEHEHEGHHAEAQYWELFSDLLLVAAASAIADVFEADQSWKGFFQFATLYLIIINGWLLYTHHYTARFEETSLCHSCILFFYLLGMAGSIVNAGNFIMNKDDEESTTTKQQQQQLSYFAWSIILQRIAFLCLLLPVGIYIPRALRFVKVFVFHQCIVLACFLWVATTSDGTSTMILLPFIAIFETLTELLLIYVLPGNTLVPIDIDHTKERLGVLILVMLGETVISSTITFRSNQEEQQENDLSDHEETSFSSYYTVLALSFLLIFMFTLLFFNVQPAPKDHAFRRSRLAGTFVIILNKFVGLALLSIGAYIKLTVEVVSSSNEEPHEEELSDFTCQLLGLSVGFALVLLLGMRLCHYGGKIPSSDQPLHIQRFFWLWWIIMAIFAAIPFGLYRYTAHPIPSLSVYSGLVLALCIIESSFTHYLEAYLPNNESTPLHSSSRINNPHNATDETKGLLGIDNTGTASSYDAVER